MNLSLERKVDRLERKFDRLKREYVRQYNLLYSLKVVRKKSQRNLLSKARRWARVFEHSISYSHSLGAFFSSIRRGRLPITLTRDEYYKLKNWLLTDQRKYHAN